MRLHVLVSGLPRQLAVQVHFPQVQEDHDDGGVHEIGGGDGRVPAKQKKRKNEYGGHGAASVTSDIYFLKYAVL